MIRRIAIGVGLLVLVPSVQAANKEMERLQYQVVSLQSQLAESQRLLEESAREIKRLNEVLAEQNAVIKKGFADQKAQGEALGITIKELSEQLAELKERTAPLPPPASQAPLVNAAEPAATVGTTPATTPPAGAPPVPSANVPAPRELYSQAYADYARGNYDLAIAAFQEYIRAYPGTDFTDNAQYWIGECLYGKKAFTEAVEAWNVLFRDYPASDKLPDARVKKGMALEKLGRRSQALVEYRFVIDRFPNSPAARIAREKMTP